MAWQENSVVPHALGQSQWRLHRVSWTLNMLTWYYIYEERGDKSFMGVEIVLWGSTIQHCSQNMVKGRDGGLEGG
jgi:hypothetical protein